jgi:hypothetical protein
MFTAWDYPVVVIAVFIGAFAIAAWIMRISKPNAKPEFECDVCGRVIRTYSAREWRYCPYCGVPRESKDLAALPRKKSILDIE